ncbi:MAG TPA: hypothetical protein VJ249_03335 [Candidatus Bathyarchaeia archaeon]|nr:hypothetical protein [Candidatus Bathyarchaeia archaeon]
MPTTSLELPFAASTKERTKAFTPSMEVAAMLLLAEAKRRKRGLLGTAAAKISFVSKLHYPLWAVPSENVSLIVDGLGLFPSVIAKQQLPDITLFVEDVERGASIRELFRNALEKNLNTFNDFAGRVHVQMDALIADKALLTALSEYVKEASTEKLNSNSVIVLAPPKLDLQAATETARLSQDLHKQIQSEIDSLDYARSLLQETMKFHEQMILTEIRHTRESYDAQIASIKPAVEKKVDQLLKERDARVAKMNRVAETELKGKEREKEKRDRELQRLDLNRADLVRKREARSRKHDKIGEAHWEHRIRAGENRSGELKARIRALAEFIEKTRAQADADVERMKQGYQWLIDQERRKITDVEAQRDEKTEAKQRENEGLKLVVEKVKERIEVLSNRKAEEAEELERLGIASQFSDITLLCLPFYLVGYHAGKTTGFHIFPPLKVMSSEGVVATIRKKLGDFRAVSRVRLFLQPRSKALSRMFDFIAEEKMKSDKVFSQNLLEAAASGNILLKDSFKDMLIKGVAELKAEDWITPKEENFVKAWIEARASG